MLENLTLSRNRLKFPAGKCVSGPSGMLVNVYRPTQGVQHFHEALINQSGCRLMKKMFVKWKGSRQCVMKSNHWTHHIKKNFLDIFLTGPNIENMNCVTGSGTNWIQRFQIRAEAGNWCIQHDQRRVELILTKKCKINRLHVRVVMSKKYLPALNPVRASRNERERVWPFEIHV